MKHSLAFLLCLSALLVFGSCQKEPLLTISSPASIELNASGGSGSITFMSNSEWTATSSEQWLSVSPASGAASDGPITISVKSQSNTTYGDRSATVTINANGLTQKVDVRQLANHDLIVPEKTYEISSDGRTINVEVQANVQYSVTISDNWIQQVQTKALTSTTLVFSVAENTTYEARGATINIIPSDPDLQTQSIIVNQAQKDAMLISDASYEMGCGGGEIEFKVQANVNFEVKSGADWIQHVSTKGLSTSKVLLIVAGNETYESREGKVELVQTNGPLSLVVGIKQNGRVAVEEIILDRTSLDLPLGESDKLIATVKPDNATDKNVSWSSDAPEVATVDQKGLVTSVSKGTATITATAGGKSASAEVRVINSYYETERDALIALYKATGGDNWTHKDNWCSDKPLDQWYGVWTHEGRVTHVMLGQNNLTGSIPVEFFAIAKMMVFDLDYNYVTGPIPEEIGNFKELTTLRLQHNLLSGKIPESLYGLERLHEIQMWTNKLTGELSERFWDMPALSMLAIDDNMITGQLTPAVKKAENLTWLGIGSNRLTGTIPEEITDLVHLHYFSIENHPISNGSVTEAANEFSGKIPEGMDKLQDLCYFLVENNNLEGSLPSSFGRMPTLQCLELYGNRFSGEIPQEVVNCDNWDLWAPDANIMPQQEGYILSFSHYESTDFSADGKVTRLQTHEKGNGITVIITGDCFTDQDIAAGKFDEIATQTMEDFFSVEPFGTFRNLFDVYSVTTVSKTSYSSYGTALGALFGEGSYVYCEEELVRQYSNKAVDNLDEALTIVIVNKNRNSGTAYMPYPEYDTDYGSGFSYACFGLQEQGDDRRLLINHEANGHGFTKLQDEYFYNGSGAFPETSWPYLRDTYLARGYYNNVDAESDPAKVSWAMFLADERYKDDGLGMFEGGMLCEKGIWRPSENSIMRFQQVGNDGDRFNAPSRKAAYIRIHKLAYGSDWQFDYEEFVQYDAINRKAPAVEAPARVPESAAMARYQHTPPVILAPRKSK